MPRYQECPRCAALLRCDSELAIAAPWRCACGCNFYLRLKHGDDDERPGVDDAGRGVVTTR
jgi:hypothetical protein